MPSNIRQTIADTLTPLLNGWTITPYERDITRPTKPTLIIRQHEYRYDDAVGRLLAVAALTVLSPHRDDLDAAEDDLDDRVGELLAGLLTLGGLRVVSGKKVTFGSAGHPGWDIQIETPIERKL